MKYNNAKGMAADPITAVRGRRAQRVVTSEKTEGDNKELVRRKARRPSKPRVARSASGRSRLNAGVRNVDAGIHDALLGEWSTPEYRHDETEDDLWGDSVRPANHIVTQPALFTETVTWETPSPVVELKRIMTTDRPASAHPAALEIASTRAGKATNPTHVRNNRVVAGLQYASVLKGYAHSALVAVAKAVQSATEVEQAVTVPRIQPCYQPINEPCNTLDVAEGTHGCTVNKANRKLRPRRFTDYLVPNLNTIGWSESSRPVDESGFMDDGCVRYEDGRGFIVSMPSTVVLQTASWLAGKERTSAMQRMAYIKVGELTRDLDLTPGEQTVCNWYAPVVAWALTEGVAIDTGVRMNRKFVGRSLFVKMVTAGVCASALLPTASAAAIAGASAPVVAPILAVGALCAGTAFAMMAAWSSGLIQPAMGPKFAPAIYTQNSTATVPVDMKDGAKIQFKREPTKMEAHDLTKPSLTPVGFCDKNHVPIALATNKHNELLALQARVTSPTPKPDPDTVSAFVRFVKRHLEDFVGTKQRRCFCVKSKTFDEWLKGCNCSTPVKETYAKCKADLDAAGISEETVLSDDLLYRYTTRKAFVKSETTLHRQAQKAPRLIQGAQPEMTVLLGPWMTAFQGWVKNRLSPERSNLVYCPGMDQAAVASFIGEWEGVAKYTEDDVSAYDASFCREIGELEVWVCKRFGAPRAVLNLMTANLNTHGYTRHGFFYKVAGTRKSGDTFTSLMNTFMNLMMHAFIYCEGGAEPVSWQYMVENLRVAAAGDDDVIMDRANRDIDWKACMRNLGFDAKPIVRAHVDQVEFCSHIMLPVDLHQGEGWSLIPKLGRTISKASVSLRARKPEDRLAILRGTALSLLGSVACSPPHEAFVSRCLDLTRGIEAMRPKDEPWKFKRSYAGQPNARTFVALERRYGWTPALQASWVDELATVNQAGKFYDLPICASFQARDGDMPHSGVNVSSEHDGVPAQVSSTPASPSEFRPVSLAEIVGEAKYDEEAQELVDEIHKDMLAYEQEYGHSYADATQYNWSSSQKARNSEQHALNGNTSVEDSVVQEGAQVVGIPCTYSDRRCYCLVYSCTCHPEGYGRPCACADKWYEGPQDEIKMDRTAYVQLNGASCAVEFAEGTSLETLVETALDNEADWASLLVRVNGDLVERPWDSYPDDGCFIRVDAKGLGGAATAALVATVTASLMRLRPAATDLIVNAVANDVIERVLEHTGEGYSSVGLTMAFQGKTHCFESGSRCYGQVFCDHTGLTTGALHMYIITSGTKEPDWTSPAITDFSVRLKGYGGSGTVSRSERILDRVMNATGVLPTSRGAILSMCDPFHDHDERNIGWPDLENSSSVVECYKQSFTVVSAQGSSANWDANVVMYPDMTVQYCNLMNNQQSSMITGAASTIPSNQWYATATGGLQSAPTGLLYKTGGITLFQNTSGGLLATPNVQANLTVLPAQATTGSSRVIGYAIEIVNNTAPLYQQGTVTVWRQPMPNSSDATIINTMYYALAPPTSNGNIGSVSALLTPEPPSTLAEAMLLSGSRQWHAKEGAMLVATSNSAENPVINGQTIASLYYQASPTDPTAYMMYPVSASTNLIATTPGSSSISVGTVAYPRTYLTPFNMSGAYFTGLSAQTTLTINVRAYVEIFPSQLTNPLTPIAQPSAPYDPAALALIAELMRGMPPGVMLSENGLGDFFKDMIGKVSSFVSPIANVVRGVAGMIPHPIAQAVSRGAGVVSDVSGQLMPASEQSFAAPRNDLVPISSNRTPNRNRKAKVPVPRQVAVRVASRKPIGKSRR